MARFFDPQELLDALVVDSEGLVYGRVGGFRFSEEGVFIQVYTVIRASERVVDAWRLAEELRRRGVEVGDDWPLDFLVRRAREEGLEEVFREAEREYKLLKGEVRLEEVVLIDAQEVDNPATGSRERVKVVVLSTPREAEFRGLKPQRLPVPPLEELLRGKLCVSLSSGVLGYVDKVVVGPGLPGLRVCRRRGEKVARWAAFMSHIRSLGEEELYRRLSGFRHPLKHNILKGGEVDEARALLVSVGAPERVLRAFDEHVQVGDMLCVDIPWEKVRTARDVVIVE
uniref:Uncharacterized protein n=1 Tax=Thermofilum pendens TaxID=2269 RepID=A0A7C3WU18_THEPE